MMSITATASGVAGCQLLVVDRKDLAYLDLDALDQAGASLLVRELDVIGARRHSGDVEPLVGVGNAVLVVLGLVGAPIRGAGRSQIEFGNPHVGEVPEPRPALGKRHRGRKR